MNTIFSKETGNYHRLYSWQYMPNVAKILSPEKTSGNDLMKIIEEFAPSLAVGEKSMTYVMGEAFLMYIDHHLSRYPVEIKRFDEVVNKYGCGIDANKFIVKEK